MTVSTVQHLVCHGALLLALLAAVSAPPLTVAIAQNTAPIAVPVVQAIPQTTPAATVGPITGLALPRFVSLRATRANLRTGPGTRYPIDWVYQRARTPLLVIAEFEQWRRVRDRQGDEGWLHRTLLSGRRTVVVVATEPVALRLDPATDSAIIAWLAPGVIADLSACADGWCALDVASHEGWLRRDLLWGP
jgi:SH3-like domain-containing protein